MDLACITCCNLSTVINDMGSFHGFGDCKFCYEFITNDLLEPRASCGVTKAIGISIIPTDVPKN